MTTSHPILKPAALVVAALTAAALATPGHAAQRADVTVVSPPPAGALVRYVSYADLDLASAAGRDRLESRIAGAVSRVCPAGHPADLTTAALTDTCRDIAWDGARAQMNFALARAANGQLALRGGTIAVSARP
jgi:UrcA family protein